ncbi:NRDE family protein [Streptomonospora litoralis]|uniref:NRDE family protein n=1 Tax=Streptomonospora litoralis TaxID=2498135 RepID=A0A4P6Q1Y0_9ACTN|nr:NRDE family protein [Streptomonospora litoralis]QBI54608.1 hypothetical protein EKD16_14135 [Streptomonospora litoralis]
MCTVIVGYDPDASTPLVLAALRDEMLDRAWQPPAAHWPERPALIGGRDTREGGTWLAAHAAEGSAPRVAALLNGIPPGSVSPADTTVPPGTTRYSRGRLPLAAAESGELGLDSGEARHYDPFHLLIADADGAVLHSWDGTRASEVRLVPGVTVLVNSGCDAEAPRARRHGPVFARTRPDPDPRHLARAQSVADLWGAWPGLLDDAARGDARTGGFGERTDDPASLIARSEFDGGRVWATSSVTLAACGRSALRYGFTGRPGDPAAWYLVR